MENNKLEQNLDSFFKKKINEFEYISTSPDDTSMLGIQICNYLTKTDIVVLSGELGSGKTYFMQSIAKYYDVYDDVSSPTFTIVNEYYSKKYNENIYHFDVYRLRDELDFLDSIGTDYFSNGICFIEWGKIIQNILPSKTIYIDINKDEIDVNKRYIKISRKENI